MADCNNLFQDFNKAIKLDEDNRVNLRAKRNSLRDKINEGFAEIKKQRTVLEALNVTVNEEIYFQSQGSYVMDTIIKPQRIDDDYDLDDGVYFTGSRSQMHRPKPKDFHTFIIESIKQGKTGSRYEQIVDKETCVRVKYKGAGGEFNYHIDIPIYYVMNASQPELADTVKSWYISNPIEFILWFENIVKSGFKTEFFTQRDRFKSEYENWLNDRRKKDHQLRRIVRYLKAWGDNLKGEMPPGVVMTILAGSNVNYIEDGRDDVCLKNTLVNIRNWLSLNGFKCPRPTTPVNEDLFKGYSDARKQYFKNALDVFILSADQALKSPNQKEACLKWQKHLGTRFNCALAKDEVEGAKTYIVPAAIKSDNARSA